MIRKILLATDGSEHSEKSDQFALDLAKPLGAEVVILCAYQAPTGFRRGAGLLQELRSTIEEDVREIIEEVAQKFQAQGLTVTALAIEGSPAEAVLKAAEQTKPDLIVIGSKGHSLLPGMLFGGVADIVQHAPVPVVVVK